MGKIHPQTLVSSSPAQTYLTCSKPETFTIWMKSLVLSGKGCTVYDTTGHVVYRVDNYNSKFSNEVHLMDFKGNVLFTILRKKFKFFGSWEGYRSNSQETGMRAKPRFVVSKSLSMLSRGKSSALEVVVGMDMGQPCQYKIESLSSSKSTCKIVNMSGTLVAEVKRKQSTSGVVLGEDVLTMVVEPCVDHALIMGLIVVHSLMNYKM